MSTFKVFGASGTNFLDNASYTSDNDIVNGFQPNTAARSIAINSYLKAVGLILNEVADYASGNSEIGPETSSIDLKLLRPLRVGATTEYYVDSTTGVAHPKTLVVNVPVGTSSDNFELKFTRSASYTNRTAYDYTYNFTIDVANSISIPASFVIPGSATQDTVGEIIATVEVRPFGNFVSGSQGSLQMQLFIRLSYQAITIDHNYNVDSAIELTSYDYIATVTQSGNVYPIRIKVDHPLQTIPMSSSYVDFYDSLTGYSSKAITTTYSN